MITLRLIEQGDSKVISNAFKEQGWNKPVSQYDKYLEENLKGERTTILAFIDGEFAGYGNILKQSSYPNFKKKNIPEIVDLNTLIKYRNKGVATKILDELEAIVFKISKTVGIGVGLLKDYGAAQALYVKRGYVPNGEGAYYQNNQINYFDDIKADDDLVLYLIKKSD